MFYCVLEHLEGLALTHIYKNPWHRNANVRLKGGGTIHLITFIIYTYKIECLCFELSIIPLKKKSQQKDNFVGFVEMQRLNRCIYVSQARWLIGLKALGNVAYIYDVLKCCVYRLVPSIQNQWQKLVFGRIFFY